MLYALVFVIAWIGALKFTTYEANSIQPLVASSPLMSWVYDVVSVTTFSALLGAAEPATAALIAVKPWAPEVSVAGSVMAIGMFVVTLSFMFTTPGVMAPRGRRVPGVVFAGKLPGEGRRPPRGSAVDAVRTLRAEPLSR